jgi:hypothetical protein
MFRTNKLASRMKIKHILENLFFLVVPRTYFTYHDGVHAQKRFKQRIKYNLGRLEFEYINLKILLGKYDLLAYRQNEIALYRGIFKGRTFYALFRPYSGQIVTFFKDGMKPGFLDRKDTTILDLDLNIMRNSKAHIKLSKHFAEHLDQYKLVSHKPSKNTSVYEYSPRERFVFSHDQQLVTKIFQV